MPSKLDELFYEIGFRVDERGVKKAQSEGRAFNKIITDGQSELERFGETGTAALRSVGETASRAAPNVALINERVGDLVDSLRTDLARGIANARLEFEQGLIDEDEFRDTVRASVEAFESELAGLERRLERTGQLPPAAQRRIVREFRGTGDEAVDAFIDEFAKDADRAEEVLRDAGREGGRRFGKEVEDESKDGLSNLEKFLRGGFIAGIVTALGFAAQRVARFVGDTARKITETLRRAGEIEGVERAFDTLASAAGLNAVDLLAELRRGARSTASDIDLMRAAAEALQTGLRGTEEQFGDLVNIGRRLAKTIGTDASDAFQRLVRGVVRGRRRILDDIGILVDFEQAHADFAAQLGVSVQALSEQQKAQARLNAVVERGNEIINQLGPDILTTGERVDQVATFLRNVTNETIAAVATTPRVATWLNTFADGSEAAAENMKTLELVIGATTDVIVDSFSTFEGFVRLLNELAKAATGGAFGTGFAEQFGQAIARRAQQQRLREIRGISDTERLERERLAVREQMLNLQEERIGGVVDEAEFTRRILNLNEQLLTIAQQRRRLALDPDGGDDGLSEEEIQARIDAVGDLIERMEALSRVGLGALQFEELTEEQQELVGQLVEVRAEIEKLEAVMETGRGTDAMARRLEFLRGEVSDLEEEITETIQGFDDLEEAVGEIAEGFGADAAVPDQPLIVLEDQAQKLNRLRAELQRLERQEGDTRLESVKLAALLDELGISFDDLSQALQLAIIRIIGYENAVKTGIIEPSEDGDDSVQKLSDTLEDIADGARGVLALADAFGVLDDNTQDALEGLVGVADAAASIATVGLNPGNFFQAAGGLAQLASGIFGLGPDPEQQRLLEAVRDLRLSLDRLKESIDAQRRVFEQTEADLLTRAIRAARGQDLSGVPADDILSVFTELLGDLSVAEVEALGEALGISVDALIKFKQVGVKGAELEEARRQAIALIEALNSLDLREAFNSLTGQLSELRTEFELFDINKPLDQLREMRKLLLEFADLPPEIAAAIQNADLSTPEGRAQFESAIQQLFRLLQTEQGLGIIPEGMTRQDFIAFLRDLEGLEDRIGEAAGEGGPGARSFFQEAVVTEITATRIESILTTMDLRLSSIDANTAQLVNLSGGDARPAGGFLEPGGFGSDDDGLSAVPFGGPLIPVGTLEPPPTEQSVTQQLMLQVAVDADIDLSGIDSPEDMAALVAEIVGDRISDDVSRQLGRRLQQLLRNRHGVGMERRV